jgi:hypothetical protein
LPPWPRAAGGRDWAFLAELDPRTTALWGVARRLIARELHGERADYTTDDGREDGGEGGGEGDEEGTGPRRIGGLLWRGDALGVLSEAMGMGRRAFVEDACRLLSLETLRLAYHGAGSAARRLLLRSFTAALTAERAPLRAWCAATRAARAAEKDKAAAAVATTASPANSGQDRGISVYDGDSDGARPLPAKTIVAQVCWWGASDLPLGVLCKEGWIERVG